MFIVHYRSITTADDMAQIYIVDNCYLSRNLVGIYIHYFNLGWKTFFFHIYVCKFFLGPPALPFFGSLFFIPQIPGVIASCSKWFINKWVYTTYFLLLENFLLSCTIKFYHNISGTIAKSLGYIWANFLQWPFMTIMWQKNYSVEKILLVDLIISHIGSER